MVLVLELAVLFILCLLSFALRYYRPSKSIDDILSEENLEPRDNVQYFWWKLIYNFGYYRGVIGSWFHPHYWKLRFKVLNSRRALRKEKRKSKKDI